MNRNTIIGLIIIFGLMIGFSLLTRPSKEEIQRKKQIQDSLMVVQQRRIDSLSLVEKIRREQDSLRQLVSDTSVKSPGQPSDQNQAKPSVRAEELGAFAGTVHGEESIYYIENEYIRLGISTKGGKVVYAELKDYITFDSMPLVLYDPKSVVFGFSFFANNRLINTDNLYFKPQWKDPGTSGKQEILFTGTDTLRFGMRLYANGSDTTPSADDDQYVEYTYSFTAKQRMIGFDVSFYGLQDEIASNTEYISLTWKADLFQQEQSIDRFNGPTIYYRHSDDEVDFLSETKDDEEAISTRLKWISFKQRFFCTTLVSEDLFSNADIRTYTKPEAGERYLRTMESEMGVPYNAEMRKTQPMSIYFGPLRYSTLRDYKIGMERQIPLGWSFFLMHWINRYAVIPVFDFLSGFGWNYGIIILVLTILLKIVLLPIAYKTYMSTAKMRVLKPDVEEINKKYPKKEDAMKKQQATMELYKRAGANPMAGCVPMLLQFPILIAMFRFFPASIELRQQSFLWAHDLSTYDSILTLPFNIPFYGEHVSLFTLLMTISTIIYTKINNDMMSTGQQIQGMKTISYLMPIMFLGFFNSYAAALSYYYLLANLLTFGQMYLFRRFVNEKKIHARIEENKKKPVKKGGFQRRLEEMARQRGAYTRK
jgi:YidC/Oxa1 family membrane protein insertase